MIKFKSFVFGSFMENTYVLYDDTNECVIIDPGCYTEEEKAELADYIKENELKVVKLLNTHGHIDHVLGNQFVKNTYGVDLYMHKIGEAVLQSVKSYASNYGFANYEEASVDQYIDEGNQIKFGNSVLDIVFVPGHSPGHLAFYNLNQKICFGGDVLFKGSIGRTDLPGGDFNILIESIHNKIFPMGDDMIVHSGHGPETQVGYEKMTNPFCAIKTA